MLLAKSTPIVVISMTGGSHFARERLIAFTPWHLDAVSGSHPPHLFIGGYCCKSPKRRSRQFLAEKRNKRQSPVDRASNPIPESPTSLARCGVVPHVVIQSSHLRLGEFESHAAKGLLQHGVIPGSSQTKARESALQERMRPASCGLATMESDDGILCRTGRVVGADINLCGGSGGDGRARGRGRLRS